MRILGIDPGSTSMGFAILDSRGSSLSVVRYGVTAIKERSIAEKLVLVRKELLSLIQEHSPTHAGIERLFFSKNKKTAFEVAQARGVILLTLLEANLPVVELTPAEIKIAVTNYGASDKRAVAKMAGYILKLDTTGVDDNATDALAVAIAASRSNLFTGHTG